jgi:hypothetical protein
MNPNGEKPNGEKFIQMLTQLNRDLYINYKKNDFPSQITITFTPNEITRFQIKFNNTYSQK